MMDLPAIQRDRDREMNRESSTGSEMQRERETVLEEYGKEVLYFYE